MTSSELAKFLVHEPNANLPTSNNPCTVDYFYRIYVLPVARESNQQIFYFCTVNCH